MTLRRWEFANAGSSFAFFDMLYAVFYVVYVKVSGSLLLVNIFGAIAASLMLVYKTLVLATLSSFARGLLFARAGQRAKLALPVKVATYVLTAVNCVLAVAYLGVTLWMNFGDVMYRSGYLSVYLHANRIHSVPMILIFIGSLASLAASVFIFTKVKTQYPTLKKVRFPPSLPALRPYKSPKPQQWSQAGMRRHTNTRQA